MAKNISISCREIVVSASAGLKFNKRQSKYTAYLFYILQNFLTLPQR